MRLMAVKIQRNQQPSGHAPQGLAVPAPAHPLHLPLTLMLTPEKSWILPW